MPERDIQKFCMDWLVAKKIFAWRTNTGGFRVGKQIVRYGIPGMADIQAIPVIDPAEIGFSYCMTGPERIAIVLWLECKSDVGKQSPEQKSFQKWVESQRQYYLIIRKPEDLTAWAEEHGICN